LFGQQCGKPPVLIDDAQLKFVRVTRVFARDSAWPFFLLIMEDYAVQLITKGKILRRYYPSNRQLFGNTEIGGNRTKSGGVFGQIEKFGRSFPRSSFHGSYKSRA
jgi:hypothetical protein